MKNANWAESGVLNVADTKPIKELGRHLRLGHKVIVTERQHRNKPK